MNRIEKVREVGILYAIRFPDAQISAARIMKIN